MGRSTVLGTLGRLALFAASHSALAAPPVKRRLGQADGDRRAEGVYRLAYNAVSVLATGALVRSLWRLPDRPLYRVGGPARAAMVAAQGVGVLGTLAVAREVGPARFSGLAPLADLLAGRPPSAVPTAQHPVPAADGDLRWGGPFRLCRHPNNAFPLLVLGFAPTMTAKLATFSLGTAAYMVVGSWHEERRLQAAFGGQFERYRRDVPHLLLPLGQVPRPPRRRAPAAPHG